MKERPILFNGEMVRAILDGRKTQTRRVVMSTPWSEHQDGYANWLQFCPYGVPGDRLWVRETLSKGMEICGRAKTLREATRTAVAYKDGMPEGWLGSVPWQWNKDKLSARFMPRWASRITLEIVNVRVERVQEITEEDAKAEGCAGWYKPLHPDEGSTDGRLPSDEFGVLWDSINAKRGFGWDVNPYVWVIEFKVV